MDSLVVAVLTLALTGGALAQGGGPGKGPRWEIGAGNTPGWALMSPEERIEHRNRIMSFRSFEECTTYVEGHHRLMQARAKEHGQVLPASPRSTICERMRRAGRLR